MGYVVSIDQSTSATKGILFNLKGEKISEVSYPHAQYYPKPGWVEHDPEEIYMNVLRVISSLLKTCHLEEQDVLGICITNQRETIVVWDKRSGKPVYNAIVWQCLRGAELCEEYRKLGYEGIVRERTGLLLDPYFSASKLKWIMENVKPPEGKTLAGTMDSWLIWKLTRGAAHATDPSNASRTMLLNIKTLSWDDELLRVFGIPASMMPNVMPCNGIFGYTDCDGLLKREVPISGVMGDSQAALFGEGCFEKGMTKVTYGTGSSIAMNIGGEYLPPPNGIVTSVGWAVNNEVSYIYEGNVHATGATLKWLLENLEILETTDEIEKMCLALNNNEGVYFVPALSGLGAPYWKADARGMIYGLTFKTRKEHIVRAAVEAIAYQIRDVLEVLMKHAGVKIGEMRADGGATRNSFLMQFQADILGIPVLRARIEEISALGSFLMGGLGFGIWKNLEEVRSIIKEKEPDVFMPKMRLEEREKLYKEWKEIVQRILI